MYTFMYINVYIKKHSWLITLGWRVNVNMQFRRYSYDQVIGKITFPSITCKHIDSEWINVFTGNR
jgi:hypothetical protein